MNGNATGGQFVPREYRARYSSLAGMSDAQLEEHWQASGRELGLIGAFSADEAAALHRDRFKPWEYRLRYADLDGMSDSAVIEHFLAFGRREGRVGVLTDAERAALGADVFAVDEYRDRYPELEGLSDAAVTADYLAKGIPLHREGRLTSWSLDLPTNALRESVGTIVVVIHEASRTGVPILAWNGVAQLINTHNVVVLFAHAGPLLDEFAALGAVVVVAHDGAFESAAELQIISRRVHETYAPETVIAATTAISQAVAPFALEGMATVLLVHEYAPAVGDSSRHAERLGEALSVAPSLFSSESVLASYVARYTDLDLSLTHIVRQGAYSQPAADREESASAAALLRDLRRSNARLVLGVGSVNVRKGVDLFIEIAERAIASDPNPSTLRFVWLGARDPATAIDFEQSLVARIDNAGLSAHVHLAGEVQDVQSFYELANVTLLPSRRDALPNSALDSLAMGVPVVAFADAGGIAEIMAVNDVARELVVPYLDVAAAARRVGRLLTEPDWAASQAVAAKQVVSACLNMPEYFARILEIGRASRTEVTFEHR